MAAMLIITADDLGLHPSYDAGILEAATAGKLDAVSVMALRLDDCRPAARAGVALGLHLDAGDPAIPDPARRRIAGCDGRLPRRPSPLPRHRRGRCRLASRLDLPVRSVDDDASRTLRSPGVRTPDLLIGGCEETEPVRPPELDALPGLDRVDGPPGHRPGPKGFPAIRRREEEDLEMLLGLRCREGVTASFSAAPARRRRRASSPDAASASAWSRRAPPGVGRGARRTSSSIGIAS